MEDYKIYIEPSLKMRKFLKEHMIYTPKNTKTEKKDITEQCNKIDCDIFARLTLNDLKNVFEEVQIINDIFHGHDKKIYFHELMEDCKIILPKFKKKQRNPQLEKRCEILTNREKNNEYKKITQNVVYPTTYFPEDSIQEQFKHLDKQVLAVLQCVISVVSGFFFGFSGVTEFVDLEMGDRILLGICCAIAIAIAELYFLVQKMNDY